MRAADLECIYEILREDAQLNSYIAYILGLILLVAAQSGAGAVAGIAAYKGPDPIGGGAGYTRCGEPAPADYTVRTIEQLKAALASAKAGETIYVPDGAVIDATGELSLKIPGGVTLAGSRGLNGWAGSTIKADKLEIVQDGQTLSGWGLFEIGGPGVRITGLRIQGPDTTIRKEAYEAPNCDAIRCSQPGLEVDNCEIWGWSHSGITLRQATGASIHHCFIHHCRRAGLGYGVCLDSSQALIQANHFVDNRHDIAGTGRVGTSYRACYNISEAIDPPISHAFDMHGNHESRPEGQFFEHFAGDSIVICYNTFKSRQPREAVRVRGRPRVGVTVFNNVFENPYVGARFFAPCDNAQVYGNVFGAVPSRAYYLTESDGNLIDGVRVPAGSMKTLPKQTERK